MPSRKTLLIGFLVLSISTLSCLKIVAFEQNKDESSISPGVRPYPYLLLVTFYTKKSWKDIDEKWINIINNTPYNGIAVMLDSVVSSKKPVTYDSIVSTLEYIRNNSKKHIWPWVFFNRFMQRKPEKRGGLSNEAWNYFNRIKGMDIYNQTGALNDFKEIFRLALKASKYTGTPGILVDHEAYNDHRLYELSYLSKLMGKSEMEISRQLKSVGSDLAKIIAEEYPNAFLWFLSLNPNQSTTLIAEGILDEAEASSIPLTVIEGGENTIGYVNASVRKLERNLSTQQRATREWSRKYGKHFQIGGTIALTDTPGSRSGFIKRGYGKSNIKSVADLKPILTRLFESRQYVFIYAASAALFNPFDLVQSKQYHSVIRDTLSTMSH